MRRALDSVHGVDLNPFAVAIARFRLAVAALHAAGVSRLADAPAYPIHVAVGDSLLGGVAQGAFFDDTGAAGFHYRNEDIHEHPEHPPARPLPRRRRQPALHHGQGQGPQRGLPHALHDLPPASTRCPCRSWSCSSSSRSAGAADQPAGFVGQITVELLHEARVRLEGDRVVAVGQDVRNPVDLLDVIDTSGAYIPGHGTPTVILVGRRRRPVAPTVRAVLGVRGEPGQPDDPAKGLVWTEIVEHIDDPGFDGNYVTVTDLDRDVLKTHPWTSERRRGRRVKEAIDASGSRRSVIGRLDWDRIHRRHPGGRASSSPTDARFERVSVDADWLRAAGRGRRGSRLRMLTSRPTAVFPYDDQSWSLVPSKATSG